MPDTSNVLLSVAIVAIAAYALTKYEPRFKLQPLAVDANAHLGAAVAMSGAHVFVAAPDEDHAGVFDAGAVHVFARSALGVWGEAAHLALEGAEPNAHFGSALAVSAQTAAVSTEPWAVVVYELVSGSWALQATVKAPGPAIERFGADVALSESGSLLVVGAAPSAAYVYERRGSGWEQVARLAPAEESAGKFGCAVAASGSRIAVGSDPGEVFVYEQDGSGAWGETGRLTADDGEPNDHFGAVIAMDGPRIVVAAPKANPRGLWSGAVYLFEAQAGVWAAGTRLTPSNGNRNDRFGVDVALDGDRVVVGAYETNHGTGSAYVFGRGDSGAWTQLAELTAPDGAAAAKFGRSVAVADGTAIVGAYFHGKDRRGAAYSFGV